MSVMVAVDLECGGHGEMPPKETVCELGWCVEHKHLSGIVRFGPKEQNQAGSPNWVQGVLLAAIYGARQEQQPMSITGRT